MEFFDPGSFEDLHPDMRLKNSRKRETIDEYASVVPKAGGEDDHLNRSSDGGLA
jgi:hypothetical protein